MKHEISRIRHELVRRSLVIRHKEFVTPKMLRLTLAGDELQGFTSLASDDHIKMFAASEDGSAERRDYTPRRYDAEKNELIVDFAIHEAGPVTAWARAAKVGDTAEIGGPRGSLVVPQDFDWWLLIGDETALPAIGRWIEELPRSAPVTSLVSVTGSEEEQSFIVLCGCIVRRRRPTIRLLFWRRSNAWSCLLATDLSGSRPKVRSRGRCAGTCSKRCVTRCRG